MKILVVQIGRYGDMILTTPLIQALREHYAESEIHVLASVRNHEILEHQSLVDVVHVYRKNLVDMMQSFHSLRSERFDILIDPKDHFSQESTFFSRVIRSEVSIGFNASNKKVFTYSVPEAAKNDAHDPPLHAVDRNLQALAPLGVPIHNRRPRLECSRVAINASFDIVPKPKAHELTIVFNISAGQAERSWQASKWVTLGRTLKRPGRRVVILAAPPEHETAKKIVQDIGWDKVIPFYAENIHDTVAMISRADLLVTPDSAPVHIASAFDVPCVALYNGVLWNLYKFYPLSTLHAVAQPDISAGEIGDIASETIIPLVDSVLSRIIAQSVKE